MAAEKSSSSPALHGRATAMSTALFLLINKNVLPSYLGSSFGFIAPITAVTTANKGIAVASFGIMITGLLLALVGVLVHFAGARWIDIIMPPVVNGAIVAIIGFNLAPSVWSNFQKAPDTAVVTLLAVLLVAVLFKGLLGRLNILIGVIIGYIYACIRGQVDFSAIGEASWVGLPNFHLPQVDFSILPMFVPVPCWRIPAPLTFVLVPCCGFVPPMLTPAPV